MVLGNLGIASQLLRMVVVVSYFYYYLFYIQFWVVLRLAE